MTATISVNTSLLSDPAFSSVLYKGMDACAWGTWTPDYPFDLNSVVCFTGSYQVYILYDYTSSGSLEKGIQKLDLNLMWSKRINLVRLG